MRSRKALVYSLVLNLLLGTVVVAYGTRKLVARLARRTHVSLPVARAGHFQDLARGGAKADVVLVGDSLTQWAEWSELLGRPVANRGIADDTVALVRRRLADVVELEPRVLFLMVGVNDLFQGESPEQLAAKHVALLRELTAALPRCRIAVQSVLPVREATLAGSGERITNLTIARTNALLERGAREAGVEWIDVASCMMDGSKQLDARYTSDGLHLSGAGYRVWAEALRARLP